MATEPASAPRPYTQTASRITISWNALVRPSRSHSSFVYTRTSAGTGSPVVSQRAVLLSNGWSEPSTAYLNGKVFDYIGISPAAQEARKFEPQVAERAPLVMPPNANQLPQPGSGQAPVVETAWPDDPEARKLREAKERERLHMAYCRGDAQWKEKVLNKESVGAPRSPYGVCPTLIGGATINGATVNAGNKE